MRAPTPCLKLLDPTAEFNGLVVVDNKDDVDDLAQLEPLHVGPLEQEVLIVQPLVRHVPEVIALKGGSYRLKNRDLGRVPAAGTTED
jgi:hypothetical protein